MAESVISINQENFQETVLGSEVPVMVEFFAQWCGPCRMMSPALEELSSKYNGKLKVAKADIEDSGNLTQDLSITTIPTVLFFFGGKEVNRKMGLRTKQDLETDVLGVLHDGQAASGVEVSGEL